MNRYEFALLRYVHNIAGGEFANIGVVMFDADANQLFVRVTERYRRLSCFFGDIDGPAYHSMVRHVERSLETIEELLRAPDAIDPPPTTLRDAITRVLPDDDSAIRTSHVMYGVHEHPAQRFAELYEEFVEQYDTFAERDRRDDDDLRRDFTNKVQRSDLRGRVVIGYEIQGPNYSHKFAAGWRNGKPQVLDTISFDLIETDSIVEKATHWSGRLLNLTRGADFDFTAMVAPPVEPTLGRAFDKALAILRTSPSVKKVLMDTESDEALRIIREDTDANRHGNP